MANKTKNVSVVETPVAPAVVVSAAMQKVIDAARVQAAQPTKGKRGKTPQVCQCGCTRLTKGGKYFPGDDSKHKSCMIRAFRAGITDEAVVARVADTMGSMMLTHTDKEVAAYFLAQVAEFKAAN